MTLVRIAELSKHVGGTVHLDAISCCPRPGSFTVLLGATRAGLSDRLREIMADLRLAGIDREQALALFNTQLDEFPPEETPA